MSDRLPSPLRAYSAGQATIELVVCPLATSGWHRLSEDERTLYVASDVYERLRIELPARTPDPTPTPTHNASGLESGAAIATYHYYSRHGDHLGSTAIYADTLPIIDNHCDALDEESKPSEPSEPVDG